MLIFLGIWRWILRLLFTALIGLYLLVLSPYLVPDYGQLDFWQVWIVRVEITVVSAVLGFLFAAAMTRR